MPTQILRGATVIDAHRPPHVADVVVEGDLITAVVGSGQARVTGAEVVDLTGLLLLPGLVDIQVHFREPGGTEAEDIATGAEGAARGGVTAVVMMPNTSPPLDHPDIVADVLAIGARAQIDVHTSATLSVGRLGERLVDFAALHAVGVRVFTDDGNALADSGLMRQALQASTGLPGMVVSQHAEDESLVAEGAINEGTVAALLGLRGRPAEAEEVVVARDVALARLTGGRYHVLHLSTALALGHVRRAKAAGVQVTCEVTPQHLVLTEQDVVRLGSDGKMNPPLRTAADVQALRRAAVDGTVDAIASDHAPHAAARKALPLDLAPPGMLGVETAAAVVWTHLVGPGVLTPAQAVGLLSVGPAAIAGLHRHGGPIAPGRPANLCVFDPQTTWVVDADRLASRSRNSPFAGACMTGRAVRTIVNGCTVHDQIA